MSHPSQPEVWLRGAIPGIVPLLQPAAHAFLQIREEMERLLPTLSADEAWTSPGGAPSVGYHARHLAGSTDRLLAYARGATLDDARKARLAAERVAPSPLTAGTTLWGEVAEALDDAIRQLHDWSTHPGELLAPREVGRDRLPSTVLGLLFHAAEHAQRHAGQVTTTARVVRGLAGVANSA